jgi:phosphonate transport system substrate-binding protein
LAYSFLKDSGISPTKDLSANSFYDDRKSDTKNDERDVVERVNSGEFDAGAVSQRVMETMAEDGTLPRDSVRIFWSSPGYSHCCFTSQTSLDPTLAAEIESAFLSVTADDPVGKAVLEGEACDRFVPGTDIGWELIEKAAEAEGLI